MTSESSPHAAVTTVPAESESPPSGTPSVSYCGVTFAAHLIRGTTTKGMPTEIPRSDITGLAMHAVVSRGHALTRMSGAIALFVMAGGVGLNAIGAVHLLGGALLNSRGVQVAIIIALVGPAVRLFSTAWDPRHVLAVTTHGGTVTLDLRPAPEPFQLMETLEDVEKGLGYSIDLYPDQTRLP